MKILIMGPPTSNGYKSFGVDSGITGGGWVENLIKNLYYNYKEILDINTCFYGDFAEKVEKKTFLNINYYVLPVRVKGLTYCSSDMEQDIKNVISDCRPDIVHIIGTEREHNLKMFEIVGKKAVDLGDFYRVPADNRGLNYDKYFKDGDVKRNKLTEFNSNNTKLLNKEEIKAKMMELTYIQGRLAEE